ncbi:solute carrier family 22 member 21 [Elysia marginata]|uniref:Solute carrier family 22 member 21 n=1 Tax=Elysia marginata TaxID=1093978 RepID=A0AAV4FJD5_9GAST|nr:solute carrier family 22 member 21 [Elysia marginata]
MPSQEYQSVMTGNSSEEKLPGSHDRNSQDSLIQKKAPVRQDKGDCIHTGTLQSSEGDEESISRVKKDNSEKEKRLSSQFEGDTRCPRHGNSQRQGSGNGDIALRLQPSPNSNARSKERSHVPRQRSCSNPNPHFCRNHPLLQFNGDLQPHLNYQHHQSHRGSSSSVNSNRHGGDLHGRLSSSADDRLRFTSPPSPSMRQKSPYITPPTSPSPRQKSLYFTPPPSPGMKSKSSHSSPSLQSKNHHGLASHSFRNGKKPHSSRSESSEEEKCLPQMESIMKQMASGKVTTDSMVNNFGGCGPFQVLLVLATYAAQISAVWGVMFMAFGNYHPKWWCYDNAQHVLNSSTSIFRGPVKTISDSVLPNGTSSSDGDLEKAGLVGGGRSAFVNPATGGVWSIRPGDSRRDNETGTCSILKKCAAVEFDPTSSTVASEWALICEEAWSQSAIISIQMTGVLVGACLGGFIGDRRGRKVTLYGHLFFMAVFNIVAIFSPSWQVFAFFRFLIGDCVGAILACCIIYPMEFVDMWWRGILGALPVWNVGAVSFSVAVWLLKDWKQLHIATAVLSLLIFFPVFWVPESMRWLAVHGKVDDAKCIANRIASMNGRPMPNTTVLEIIAKEEKRMSRLKGTYSKYTVLDLFADRFIRRISIRMGLIWCFMSAAYYALSFGIKNFSGDFYINFIAFSAAEVPGMLFVAPATNKLGRRLGSVVYFASTTVCCAAVIVVSFAASASVRGTIITVLAMLAKMHILAVWMMVTVFCTELYPTVIRNLSIGYLNACARVGGIAAPFLLPNSSDFLFVSFLIMGSLMVTCCYLLKTLPETKGRPLEDTIKARSCLSIIVEETELEVRVSESA